DGSLSRGKVFVCRPTASAEESNCARAIISKSAARAFRRPLTPADTDQLMKLYDAGAEKGGFEIGVREALSGILASPDFVLKTEALPATLAPARKRTRLNSSHHIISYAVFC